MICKLSCKNLRIQLYYGRKWEAGNAEKALNDVILPGTPQKRRDNVGTLLVLY